MPSKDITKDIVKEMSSETKEERVVLLTETGRGFQKDVLLIIYLQIHWPSLDLVSHL